MSQQASLISSLSRLADEIGLTKRAAKKTAADTAPGADPGTSHPSGQADNGTMAAKEGDRAAENTADNKKQQGDASVASTPANRGAQNSQDAAQLNIGSTQSLTGEDPKTEDAYRDRTEDPGTTHPARVGEEKYAGLNIRQLHKQSVDVANSLLADMANGFLSPSQAAPTPSPSTEPFAQLTRQIEKTAAAVIAQQTAVPPPAPGYDLATAMGIDKAAAAQEIAGLAADAMADGQFDADLFGAAYLAAVSQLNKTASTPSPRPAGQRKRAFGEAGEGEDHNRPGDSGAGTDSPEGTGPKSGDRTEQPAGEGGEGAMPLSEAVGPNGQGGDGFNKEEILQELIAALQELGIPLEGGPGSLAAGGGPGMAPPPEGAMPPGAGMPPGMDPAMAGGMPPGGDPAMAGAMPPLPPDEGMKLAAVCKQFQRSGRFRFKAANDGTRERDLRDRVKEYIKLVVKP